MGAQRSRVQLPYASFLPFLTYAHDTPCLSVRVAIFPSTFGAVYAQLWNCCAQNPAICARVRLHGNVTRYARASTAPAAAAVTRGSDLARRPGNDCHVTIYHVMPKDAAAEYP